MNTVGIAYTTLPNREQAHQLAKLLIDQKLVACCNIIPGAESIYSWQDELCIEEEVILLMKTQSSCFDALEAQINKHHPNQLPCLLFFESTLSLEAFRLWIVQQTSL